MKYDISTFMGNLWLFPTSAYPAIWRIYDKVNINYNFKKYVQYSILAILKLTA